jgi:hypothetical protein
MARKKEIEKSVLRVGDNRGFVTEHNQTRLIITAAHCLPTDDDGYLKLPPAMPAMYLNERIYQNLLGPLGAEPMVWCECLFVNPVADVAILGSPDGLELYDQAMAFEALVESMAPLSITDARAMYYQLERRRGGVIRIEGGNPSLIIRSLYPSRGKALHLYYRSPARQSNARSSAGIHSSRSKTTQSSSKVECRARRSFRPMARPSVWYPPATT